MGRSKARTGAPRTSRRTLQRCASPIRPTDSGWWCGGPCSANSRASHRAPLDLNVGLSAEALGYRNDGAISRLRYTANSNWNLLTLSVPPRSIARSSIPVRLIDAFNIPDLQFFSADTSRDAMEGRIAEMVSGEIFTQVAIALRKYVADGRPGAAGGPAPAVSASPPRAG